MRILVLAGHDIEEIVVERLLAGVDYSLFRHAAVSRGVRRLEKVRADAVLLIPDAADESWPRALQRLRDDFNIWTIMICSEGMSQEAQAFEFGVFDVFALGQETARQLVSSLRHLARQMKLEEKASAEAVRYAWVEDVGRFGSWCIDARGKTTWSPGVRRIFKDEAGVLTEDFSSVRQFIVPEDLEIFDQANKATFMQGWPLDFEYRIQVTGESLRYLHLHRHVELDSDGHVAHAMGLVRDVTAEREFENFLFRRDAILQVVSSFAERYLRESDWESGVDRVLEALGKAADVTRVFIFCKMPDEDGDAAVSMKYEWAASSVKPLINHPEVKNQKFSPIYDRWRYSMIRRKIVAGHVRNFQTEERRFFEMSGTKSILIVPVFVGSQWWGFIGFSEQREERDWLPVEIESLTMVADIFGSAILRRSMEDLLHKANRSAEEAKTIALEASKSKSRFLANMSHEIRTPISGILGIAEMTITTGLTREQREHMDMIRDAARSLLAIVNDVLDISKIEANKMSLKPEDFEFRSALETVVRPFGSQADSKGILFRYRVADAVPAYVYGDPERLGQILRNLIGNAMKFTERGLIELLVDVVEQSSDQVCLVFSVQDTGEGIAADKLDTIFESFTQADSSMRKKHQGTGLGLTISKELVEMMGGAIRVESELDRGSLFVFTARFGVPKQPEAVVAPKQVITPQVLHLNILLAEDNPLNQRFLSHFLTIFGHTVVAAKNGIEALEVLKEQGRKIDIVLMDIQMPEMGGIEATKAIRDSDGRHFDPQIPVIALTAYAMEGDKESMLEAGMNDYVSKPVDMKELSSAIARSAPSREPSSGMSMAPSSQRVRERTAAKSPMIELDMESLIIRFEGNMDLLKDILDLFLLEAEEKLRKLDAGTDDEDPQTLGAALHSITNIASHVLAMGIVNQARSLERKCLLGQMEEVLDGVIELRPKFVALVNAVRERAKTL